MDKKKFILEFIKRHTLAVIATVNRENKVEAAVIEFGETENLELIFDTLSNSRKHRNIKRNSIEF